MSYKLEGKDIVIAGFEQGIADSPYAGIADMRNVNLVSYPGEASVNYKMQALTIPPVLNAVAFTATDAGDLFTWAGSSALYNGMAIVLNTFGGTGPTTGVVYYVRVFSATTFKIYSTIAGPNGAVDNGTPVAVTGDGSGTFTSYQMGKPMHSISVGQLSVDSGIPLNATFMVDSKNQVWFIVSLTYQTVTYTPGTAIFLGNIGSTISSSTGNSICVWNGYLFLFRSNSTDYWPISALSGGAPLASWVYGWVGYTPGIVAAGYSLENITAQDDAIYICNGHFVGSILETPGEDFDPTDPTTYTSNTEALKLPETDSAISLAELGTSLLVGGANTFIYPWDRVSTSYSYPIVVPERYIAKMVSTNSNVYVFAGNRGRIYISNLSNIDEYKKIPDYVSGNIQPYYRIGGNGKLNSSNASAQSPWGDAKYWRGQIYFSFSALANDRTVLTTVVGIWALNISTGAIRMVQKMSYNTYAGFVGCITPDLESFTPGGEGLIAGWVDGSGNVGIDCSVTTPYDNYETFVESDMIPVGTFLDPFSPSQVEWKTSVPLVAGESIKLLYRTNLAAAFAAITDNTHTTGESNTVGSLSDVIQTNFQKAQWVQLRAEYKSTATTPSYTRLTELRIRDFPSGKNAR